MPSYTYRCEYVACGKQCRGCPHGPYWYGYWREAGRLRKRYFGREDPRPTPSGHTRRPADPREAIFARQTASLALACQILGIFPNDPYPTARSAWLRAVKDHHPDRGGDEHEFQLREAAWSYLKSARGWR